MRACECATGARLLTRRSVAVRQRQHHIDDDERLGDVTVTSHTRARGCDVTQRPFRVRQTTITRREYASARGGRAGGLAYTHRQAAERWTTHTHTHTRRAAARRADRQRNQYQQQQQQQRRRRDATVRTTVMRHYVARTRSAPVHAA